MDNLYLVKDLESNCKAVCNENLLAEILEVFCKSQIAELESKKEPDNVILEKIEMCKKIIKDLNEPFVTVIKSYEIMIAFNNLNMMYDI